jgi:hypothetical protein
MMSYCDESANIVEEGTTVAVEIARNPIHCIDVKRTHLTIKSRKIILGIEVSF